MTSIFTYETEPLVLISPWPEPKGRSALGSPETAGESLCGFELPLSESVKGYGISKLRTEPQQGPVEYKLHLLLRPRRTFSYLSTTLTAGGSHLSKHRSQDVLNTEKIPTASPSPTAVPNTYARQNRLQHLTTQLLWRLQQSSPNHSSTESNLVLPILPDGDLSSYNAARAPSPLVAGLEESKGALYEIGVSDSGEFVGLTLDEMEESLQVLAAMANSIGCRLRIVKIVLVGKCRWEQGDSAKDCTASLWVTEVCVSPIIGVKVSADRNSRASPQTSGPTSNNAGLASMRTGLSSTQVRVSLIGSTTSGKSSLLGTLSTSTLDNGRGKSRLSLLRHRHEIVSGVTSSLAQELIGYHAPHKLSGVKSTASTNIINYATPNTSSWTDIHNSSRPGRLIFLTDSAGHPKFRRTTVRGLISWAPHWTLCCIAAHDDGQGSGPLGADVTPGSTSNRSESSYTHLDLCLSLDLPVVCVITKLDLASRNGLRQTVAKILSTIKQAGRRPILLASSAFVQDVSDRQRVPQQDEAAVKKILDSTPVSEVSSAVPIVLSSALTGAGIGQVHALLSQLPIKDPTPPQLQGTLSSPPSHGVPLSSLFHLDEIFALAGQTTNKLGRDLDAGPRYILSGYLRYGFIQVGDCVLLGPFCHESVTRNHRRTPSPQSKSLQGLSKSLPKDFTTYSRDKPSTDSDQHSASTADSQPIWHSVRVTSIRHLRLPVSHLTAGQVGTLAISTTQTLYTNADPCLRRGMIVCNTPSPTLPSPSLLPPASPPSSPHPPAYKSISAVFADPNIYVNPGSTVTLYTASIRTTAKIAEVRAAEEAGAGTAHVSGPGAASLNPDSLASPSHEADSKPFTFNRTTAVAADDSAPDSFSMDEVSDELDGISAAELDFHDSGPPITEIEITFRFLNSVEWVEMGTKLLVTPASGISMLTLPATDSDGDVSTSSAAAAAGLDGFVGRIVRGET